MSALINAQRREAPVLLFFGFGLLRFCQAKPVKAGNFK